MPGLMRTSATLLCVLALPLLLGACDRETCEGACSQIYGSGEGQCNLSSLRAFETCTVLGFNSASSCEENGGTWQPAKTQAQAESDCAHDCSDALYTTRLAGDVLRVGDTLYDEHDALEFIYCVIDKDYGGAPDGVPGATTCTNLPANCGISW